MQRQYVTDEEFYFVCKLTTVSLIVMILSLLTIHGCTLSKVHPKAQVVAARSVYTNTLQTLIVLRQNRTINDAEFVKIEKIRVVAAKTLDQLELLSNDELDLPKFELTMNSLNLLLDKLIAWQKQKEDPIP